MADQLADSLNTADQLEEEEGEQSDDSLAKPLLPKTEEQLIAEAFGQVKVLVEAGQQEGYLQIDPSEVRKFTLNNFNDFEVEELDEAEPQDLTKWATAPPLGPLVNRITPQDEQQLGKIQIDPITGERYMLVPIEVDILVDLAKICDMFDAEIDDMIEQGAQETLERKTLEIERVEIAMLEKEMLEEEMLGDDEDAIVLKVHQGEGSPWKVQEVVDLSISIKATSQTTGMNLLDQENPSKKETLENSQKTDSQEKIQMEEPQEKSQKEETQEKIQNEQPQESSQKEDPQENSQKEETEEKIQKKDPQESSQNMEPQENSQKEDPEKQSLKEEQPQDPQNQSLKEEEPQEKTLEDFRNLADLMEAMIIVPPINFCFNAHFVEGSPKNAETAPSSESEKVMELNPNRSLSIISQPEQKPEA